MNSADVPAELSSLVFANRFTGALPGDQETTNAPRQVSGACFSRVMPEPASAPNLLAHSESVARLLGISPEQCQLDAFAKVFAGNLQLPGMDPYAMCYGGHQFGHWAGQLGDGRAINLGELIAPDGLGYTLQLKGAGPTPYSRSGDGYAVLRSSVREYLCSEAMHQLGVPTTRALSLVTTGDQVVRDMFYDGRAKPEPGAVVCRVSRSFLRFGSFEIHAARGDVETLRALTDFTLREFFPDLGDPCVETYVTWFADVCRRTAELMTHWMRVGFVHGVMNTDNLSILGETIDYGPYGWLENYDPDWTPNTTDAAGRRYRFGNQPAVAYWNLVKLANAIALLLDDPEPLRQILLDHPQRVETLMGSMMCAKLGLKEHGGVADDELIAELGEVLTLSETDMTQFYRLLAAFPCEAQDAISDTQWVEPLRAAWYQPERLTGERLVRTAAWVRRYAARVRRDGSSDDERRESMNAVNPKYVLRNYLAQLAIDDAEKGDIARLHRLERVLRNPYAEQPGEEDLAAKRPEWARNKPGCSMLSCSS